METKPRSLFQNSLIWGLITGGMLILFSLFLYIFDLMGNKSMAYFSYLLIVLGLVLGTLQYRNKSLGGYISYGQSLASGVLIALFAGIISALFTFIFFTYVDPAAYQAIVNAQFEKVANDLSAKGLTDEQIDNAIEMGKKFSSPLITTLSSMFMTPLVGTILMLIISIFIKKNNNSFEAFIHQVDNEQNTPNS